MEEKQRNRSRVKKKEYRKDKRRCGITWTDKRSVRLKTESDYFMNHRLIFKGFIQKTVRDSLEINCLLLVMVESERHSVVSKSLRPHGLNSPWNSPGQNMEWVAFPFSRGSSQPRDWTQGLNPGLLHCRQIPYQLSHQRSPRILEWVAYFFFGGSSWSNNRTGVSCITCRFLTS